MNINFEQLIMLLEKKYEVDLALKLHDKMSDAIIVANSYLDNFQNHMVKNYRRLLLNYANSLTEEVKKTSYMAQAIALDSDTNNKIQVSTAPNAHWIEVYAPKYKYTVMLLNGNVFRHERN